MYWQLHFYFKLIWAADCVRFYLMGYKTIVYLTTKGFQTRPYTICNSLQLRLEIKRPERIFPGGLGGRYFTLHYKSAESKSKKMGSGRLFPVSICILVGNENAILF